MDLDQISIALTLSLSGKIPSLCHALLENWTQLHLQGVELDLRKRAKDCWTQPRVKRQLRAYSASETGELCPNL